MLKIQKLTKPNKHSGFVLEPGKTIKKRGLTITNTGAGNNVYVDVWKRKLDKKVKVLARKKK